MVGKKKANVLGRSLIKSRFSNTHKKKVEENMLHVADLKDGYDWARLNLSSVTEEDSFTSFLRTAELAGTEFQAEKLNIQFVNPKSNVGLPTSLERQNIEIMIKNNKDLLKIPRRPKWDKNTTPEELHALENQSFLDWRRGLSILQEKDEFQITPYEKNLEFWRQLWRVIEKSDVVVQIVDARNPLLFRSEDLEKYVKEVDPDKENILLLNKADYLTDKQREIWADYFEEQKIKVAFFSALDPKEDDIEEEDENVENEVESDDESDDSEKIPLDEIKQRVDEIEKDLNKIESDIEECSIKTQSSDEKPQEKDSNDVTKERFNNPQVLSRLELIEFFREIRETHPSAKTKDGIIIGLMGYPNVGKSSTINALLQEKKVSVSSTPGKTKHFQTLYLDKDIILCDCCGLVLPSFCVTKADMVLNGILPIDQMRDYVPPVNLLCNLIPRHILEKTYGILISKPLEGEDPKRAPYAEELLLAYGYNRGFMTANGQPDQSRSARYILKDYVNGKLLHCYAPPTVPQEGFHVFPDRVGEEIDISNLPPRQQRSMKILTGTTSKQLDETFFQTTSNTAYVKGRNNFMNFKGSQGISNNTGKAVEGKPWKGQKREKREKLRIKYAHLDQH